MPAVLDPATVPARASWGARRAPSPGTRSGHRIPPVQNPDPASARGHGPRPHPRPFGPPPPAACPTGHAFVTDLTPPSRRPPPRRLPHPVHGSSRFGTADEARSFDHDQVECLQSRSDLGVFRPRAGRPRRSRLARGRHYGRPLPMTDGRTPHRPASTAWHGASTCRAMRTRSPRSTRRAGHRAHGCRTDVDRNFRRTTTSPRNSAPRSARGGDGPRRRVAPLQ